MKREVSKGLAQRPYARHRLRMLGLALTLAPFGIAGQAYAICTENGAASVNGSTSDKTIVCSGTVANTAPDGVTGYGTFADKNNQYTISGSLTGTVFGLLTGS